jgi:glutamate N-acetyltransferase / amino-acid N-acetyltransferase
MTKQPFDHTLLEPVAGGVCAPLGFLAAGASAGIKKSGAPDVAVVFSEQPAVSAAVFTTNQVAAAPVLLSREHVGAGAVRAVVANAGNANACTGEAGMRTATAMAAATASALGLPAVEVAVASTGVIGIPLDPAAGLLDGIDDACGHLTHDGGTAAAEAIMTTDTFAKEAAVVVHIAGRVYTVGGMVKGSGMIQPSMATMLAFVTTDAPLTLEAARTALAEATATSFNRITVDGETSTNDMCLLLANGAAGGEPVEVGSQAYAAVAAAVERVCGELARMIVRDGEGATTFITVQVTGARDDAEAEAAAMSVARSQLFKCAVFGGDANWGRVASAVGASRAHVDPDRIEVRFGDILTCQDGTAVAFDEAAAAEVLGAEEVTVTVDLHLGEGTAVVWTCDLTYDYVRINADYRS